MTNQPHLPDFQPHGQKPCSTTFAGKPSFDYAKFADCTTRAALSHLRALCAAGLCVEEPRCSTMARFRLPREVHQRIGAEIIAELAAAGLPFDDEWRASKEVAETSNALATAKHTCHWPGCTKSVPPKLWGCKEHWFRLPVQLRNRIWATYRPGQEISKRPSAEYLAAAREVQDWIRTEQEPQDRAVAP